MPREKTFLVGDFVFAKVRGYPAWPARVLSVNDPRPASLKYTVFFFGTSETAVVPAKNIHLFVENKGRFGKPLRRKYFNESVKEVEEELAKIAIEEISTRGLFCESNEKRDQLSNIRQPRKSVHNENSAPNTSDELELAMKADSQGDAQPAREKKRIASVVKNIFEYVEDNTMDDSNDNYCEKHKHKKDKANNQSRDNSQNYIGVVQNLKMSQNEVEVEEQAKEVLLGSHSAFAVKKPNRFCDVSAELLVELGRLTKDMEPSFVKSLIMDPSYVAIIVVSVFAILLFWIIVVAFMFQIMACWISLETSESDL